MDLSVIHLGTDNPFLHFVYSGPSKTTGLHQLGQDDVKITQGLFSPWVICALHAKHTLERSLLHADKAVSICMTMVTKIPSVFALLVTL